MILLGIAIVGLTIYGYFTSSLPAPFPARNRAPAETMPSSATNQLPQVQADRPFTYGSVLYSLGDTSRAEEVRGSGVSHKAGGVFLLINLTLTNQGKEPVILEPSDFTLIDGQGREFSIHQSASRTAAVVNAKADIFSEALQPGIPVNGVLVFDVPKQATGLVLRISKGYLDVKLD
ncbi:MAG: DUF4352 domain-containing protein [Dehalococcoidia bacterium]|nr:DUF4352 domain-containing protein [Dehalococcoidia bacterium]